MARKQTEMSERERLRRLRQAEEQAKANDPKSPGFKAQPKGVHEFGLVARHQKKTGRGS